MCCWRKADARLLNYCYAANHHVAEEGRRMLPVISSVGELSWGDCASGLGESIKGTMGDKMS